MAEAATLASEQVRQFWKSARDWGGGHRRALLGTLGIFCLVIAGSLGYVVASVQLPTSRSTISLQAYTQPALPSGAHVTIQPEMEWYDNFRKIKVPAGFTLTIEGIKKPVTLFLRLGLGSPDSRVGENLFTSSIGPGEITCGTIGEEPPKQDLEPLPVAIGTLLTDDFSTESTTLKFDALGPLQSTHCYFHSFEIARESFTTRSMALENDANATPKTTTMKGFAPHGAIPKSAWPVDDLYIDLWNLERVESLTVRGGRPDPIDPDDKRWLGMHRMLILHWTDDKRAEDANLLLLAVSLLIGLGSSLLIEAFKTEPRKADAV